MSDEHNEFERVLHFMRSQVNEAAVEKSYLLMEIRALQRRVAELETLSIVSTRRIRLLEQHNDHVHQLIYDRLSSGAWDMTISAFRISTANAVRAIRRKINRRPGGKGTGE